MTAITVEPTTIETAMSKIGLKEWTGKLISALDEIEFESQMKASLAQADRGEFVDLDEATSEILYFLHYQ